MLRKMFQNILKYLFGDKEIIEVHKNLEEARVMQHLWLHQQGGESYKKSQAPYVFTQNETYLPLPSNIPNLILWLKCKH
jgi:hypothetical protein